MNNDVLAGNWKQFQGKMQEQWGKLTNDDLDVAAGRRRRVSTTLRQSVKEFTEYRRLLLLVC